MPGSILNSIKLGGKTVYDAPLGGRPTNVFTMYTGGSRYGTGRFLMLASDFNALMEDTPAGMVTLEMNGSPGPGISFSVCLAGAIPYVTSPTASDGNPASTQSFANMVEAIVFDNRWQLTDPISNYLNVQQQWFPYSGSGWTTPIFYKETANGDMTTAWQWSDVCTQLNVDPEIPDPVPSSWKPRNMIYDNVAEGKVLDDVAGQLFLVVGFSDDSYTTTDFYNPGKSQGGNSQSDSGNTATLQQASNYIIAGQDWVRNSSRFPNKLGVTFPVYSGSSDPYSDISADPTSGNNTRCYEVDVNQTGEGGSQTFTVPMTYGNFVAIYSGGSVANTSELTTVANDVGGRWYTMMQLKMSEKKYAGIWPFVPDGLVRGIQWVSNANGATTTIRFNDERDFSPAMEPMRAVDSISNQLIIGMGTTQSTTAPQGSRFIIGGAGQNAVPVQFGSPLSATQPGFYNGLFILGTANSISNATPGGSPTSPTALPTSPPSGGGLYTGAACIIQNMPDVYLSEGWPVPSGTQAEGIIIGQSSSGDIPASLAIIRCRVITDMDCGA
jgi:hypothetical protein